MEATGGYWRNLFGFLVAEGFRVAVINPLRTKRFGEEDLQRTKTDAIDALGIARFAQQKRPAPTSLSEKSLAELRDLVRLRQQTVQPLGDRVRQLHRTVHLVFPEFPRLIRRRLETEMATALLFRYPTAVSFSRASATKLARIRYDRSHYVGEQLARALPRSPWTSTTPSLSSCKSVTPAETSTFFASACTISKPTSSAS